MTKLTYKDKVNIYNDRKMGLSIKSIANKYSMTTKNIQYMLCLAEKHGIDILKKEKYKNYPIKFKQDAIDRVLLNNEAIWAVSLDIGLPSDGILPNWIKKYKENGYNVETILAEKIETILRRGKFNSRMKDYYDVYYFLTNIRKNIDKVIIKEAIDNTFAKRQSFEYLNDYEEIIVSIVENNKIKDLWKKYSIKNKYAEGIELVDILNLLKDFLRELKLDVVVM